ncbi:CBS domain-containing protein [Marinospirillum insulare]|uniref:CBS domain-containing protein n=1 Tax=Marinospirillum insulare TaxID=217169 RepID=A0ABQ5ZX42_9GAMM|nr:CBS domain-containing protein [Marinospirillum insulare]GLR63643.1 hypothetical protein GCM10007878_10780 [Marinospirillum insulare]
MVFAIYEQGLRIHTPKEQLLARPAIRQTQAVSASRRMVDRDGKAEHRQDISDQSWIQGYPDQQEDDASQDPPANNRAMQAYAEVEQSKKKQIPSIPAHQVMRSPVLTLPSTASLNEAWSLMSKEQIHYLVLIDPTGDLAGVLDDRELLKEAAGVGELSKQEGVDLATTQAIQLVKAPLVTASKDTDIRDIARVMLAQKVRAMPVVDAEGTLLGLVTRSDLMLGLANQNLEVWT